MAKNHWKCCKIAKISSLLHDIDAMLMLLRKMTTSDFRPDVAINAATSAHLQSEWSKRHIRVSQLIKYPFFVGIHDRWIEQWCQNCDRMLTSKCFCICPVKNVATNCPKRCQMTTISMLTHEININENDGDSRFWTVAVHTYRQNGLKR